MGMFDWQEKSAEVLAQGGVIGPDERLPCPLPFDPESDDRELNLGIT